MTLPTMTMKNDIYEFPEDNRIVHTNMDDYTTELLGGNDSTTKSSLEDSPNRVFQTTLVFVTSAAVSLLSLSVIARYAPFIGSAIGLVIVLILREWNRIYGGLLTPRLKASLNFSMIMRDHKEYIPYYDMAWLFGARYRPYYYGCTGPSLNPEMERTPNDDDSRSPTKKRSDEKLNNVY